MNQQVSRWLKEHREEMADMLCRWVRIPSLRSDPEPGAPFGPEIRRMLDRAAEDLRGMGYAVRTFDGYALDASMGPEGEEPVAVLGHLDVVPAGDGWDTPPFEPVRKGNRVYGRGTNDDKGPVLAALFAMTAIREAGIPLKRGIRLILGGDEESGWEDMAYYQAHTEMPATGFSPDASFPLINTEKAILHLALRAPACAEGLAVTEMNTGERPNVIPGESRAAVAGDPALADRVRVLAAEWRLPYRAETSERGLTITAEGIGGHSAHPDGRRNAIGMMLKMLRALGAAGPLAELADAVGMESDGKSLGCACADEPSGPLTCNIGILRLEEAGWYGTLDLRCPVTADLDALLASVRAKLPDWTVGVLERKEPHHVPADSELVTSLLAAYEEETGRPGKPMSTGGGTYAKVLKQGVAYGALFPGDEELAHQPNEYQDLDRLLQAAGIYANALIRLCGKE